jgi:hypothetical protein
MFRILMKLVFSFDGSTVSNRSQRYKYNRSEFQFARMWVHVLYSQLVVFQMAG